VRDLEAEFANTIARSLSVPPESGARPQDFFRWADALGDLAANVRSLEEWQELEHHQVAPRLMRTIAMLDRGISGPVEAAWQSFRERYLESVEALFAAIGRRAGDRSRARVMVLSRAVDPLIPPERRGLSLSQKALLVLRSLDGVTAVLLGMREPRYVADALGMLGLPRLDDPKAVLVAARAVDVA
jgi:hypothetical protein